MTSEVKHTAVSTAFPLVVPTLANRPLAKLLLRNETGQVVQQWLIRQNKSTIGSAAGCSVRCGISGVAPYHALLVIGAKQTFIRALAPKLTRDGQAVNELLLGDEDASFEIAGQKFELLRKWSDAGSPASANETDRSRMKFTLARPFALQNRPKHDTEIEEGNATTQAHTADATWVAKLVQSALEPLECQIQNALTPLAELQAESRRQKRLRRRRAELRKKKAEELAENPPAEQVDPIVELREQIQASIAQQSASIEMVQERVADVDHQLRLIEKLVASEKSIVEQSQGQFTQHLDLLTQNSSTLESQYVQLSEQRETLATHTRELSEQRDTLRRQLELLGEHSTALGELQVSVSSHSEQLDSNFQSLSTGIEALKGHAVELNQELAKQIAQQAEQQAQAIAAQSSAIAEQSSAIADQNSRLDQLNADMQKISVAVSEQVRTAIEEWADRHATFQSDELAWKQAVASQLDAIQSRLAAAMATAPNNKQLSAMFDAIAELQVAQSTSQLAVHQLQSDLQARLLELQNSLAPQPEQVDSRWVSLIDERLTQLDDKLQQAQDTSSAWRSEILEQLSNLCERFSIQESVNLSRQTRDALPLAIDPTYDVENATVATAGLVAGLASDHVQWGQPEFNLQQAFTIDDQFVNPPNTRSDETPPRTTVLPAVTPVTELASVVALTSQDSLAIDAKAEDSAGKEAAALNSAGIDTSDVDSADVPVEYIYDAEGTDYYFPSSASFNSDENAANLSELATNPPTAETYWPTADNLNAADERSYGESLVDSHEAATQEIVPQDDEAEPVDGNSFPTRIEPAYAWDRPAVQPVTQETKLEPTAPSTWSDPAEINRDLMQESSDEYDDWYANEHSSLHDRSEEGDFVNGQREELPASWADDSKPLSISDVAEVALESKVERGQPIAPPTSELDSSSSAIPQTLTAEFFGDTSSVSQIVVNDWDIGQFYGGGFSQVIGNAADWPILSQPVAASLPVESVVQPNFPAEVTRAVAPVAEDRLDAEPTAELPQTVQPVIENQETSRYASEATSHRETSNKFDLPPRGLTESSAYPGPIGLDEVELREPTTSRNLLAGLAVTEEVFSRDLPVARLQSSIDDDVAADQSAITSEFTPGLNRVSRPDFETAEFETAEFDASEFEVNPINLPPQPISESMSEQPLIENDWPSWNDNDSQPYPMDSSTSVETEGEENVERNDLPEWWRSADTESFTPGQYGRAATEIEEEPLHSESARTGSLTEDWNPDSLRDLASVPTEPEDNGDYYGLGLATEVEEADESNRFNSGPDTTDFQELRQAIESAYNIDKSDELAADEVYAAVQDYGADTSSGTEAESEFDSALALQPASFADENEEMLSIGPKSAGEDIPPAGEAEEEDSVEDYMRKLLARMRGVPEEQVELPSSAHSSRSSDSSQRRSQSNGNNASGQNQQSGSPNTSGQPAKPSQPITSPWSGKDSASSKTMAEGLDDATMPFDPDKYVPRALAPEATRGLNAMRELANTNARTAIYTSNRQRYVTSVIVKLTVAGVGLTVGAVLIAINGFAVNIGLIAALASFVVALIWGFDGIQSMKPLLQSSLVLTPQTADTAETTDKVPGSEA